MGISCDWSRERFTMDEGCSKAVREVFVRLYEKGLIYRGNRLVNWCPCCESAISDAEVEYQEKEGNFWHLLYPVKETGEMLELATTRPETMLGDTAVAINAADPRYAHLHGCHVMLPLANREIPIICDEHADMEKGTGVVKITPSHDPNDFEVGQRHILPIVRVFTYDGHMTGAADKAAADALFAAGKNTVNEPHVLDCGKYAGITTLEARKAILAALKEGDTLTVTGPCGNGFDVAALARAAGGKNGKIAVVGGGIGTAPMFQLTRELAAEGVKPDVFFGFRDAPYCMEDYRPIANLVKVSTDTGTVGFHGFVTQLYDPADYDVVLVCGPTVMMKNAARLCAEKGTPCFVSMEKKMACGIGACLGCTCETKGGEGKSVCKNGPVFDATEVFF